MNLLIYWGVVLAGAVTLLIEAYRNFNVSLVRTPFREHPILKNMRIEQLCTPREKMAGFMFYSLLYLLAYVIALSSAEIYELISKLNSAETAIGPTSGTVTDGVNPTSVLDAQYGKPIFISASIIAIFSAGALQPVERTMRLLAHRMSGVPRGVYKVIQELHSIKFDRYKNDPKVTDLTPMADKFKETGRENFDDNHSAGAANNINTALLTIDYLAPTITGAQRLQHFSFAQTEAFGVLSDTLDDKIQDLSERLSKQPANPQERRELFDQATGIANDTIALFSVLFLRNNRSIKNVGEDDSAMARVGKVIKHNYQIEMNAFVMAVMGALAATAIAGFFLIQYWNAHEKPISPQHLSPAVKSSLEATTFDGEPLAAKWIKQCLETPDPPAKEDSGATLASTPAPTQIKAPDKSAARSETSESGVDGTKNLCNAHKKSVQARAVIQRRQDVLLYAILQPLPIALAVAVAALTAIFGRDVRLDEGSWPMRWPLRRPPVAELVTMSLIPGLLAMFAVTLGSLLRLSFDAEFDLTQNELAFFFTSKGVYFAMHFLVGFIVSVGVLCLSDQHQHHNLLLTVAGGLFAGTILLGAYFLIVLVSYEPAFIRPTPENVPFSFIARETILYGAFPVSFLCLYALFLELMEDRNDDPARSVTPVQP